MLEKLMEKLMKEAEKSLVRSMSMSIDGMSYSLQSKGEKAETTQLQVAKTSMDQVGTSVGNSVKGQFGKQAKEVIKKQGTTLANF